MWLDWRSQGLWGDKFIIITWFLLFCITVFVMFSWVNIKLDEDSQITTPLRVKKKNKTKQKTENIALSETRPRKHKMFWWDNCNPCLLYACTRILIGGLYWCIIASFLLLHILCLYSRTTSLHASMSLFLVVTAQKLWRGSVWTVTKNLNVLKGLLIANIVMSSFLSTPLRYSVYENLYCDN